MQGRCNSSAQDFAFTAKSVRTRRFSLERICPSPQATWVKFGKNIYKDTYKYTASVAERVDDLNEMIYDENVRLVFFGGGYGSVDLLPYIDYNRIKETLKLFLSYSDGTSILNAIYANTGITTYYGQTPALFDNINEYDRKQFVVLAPCNNGY